MEKCFGTAFQRVKEMCIAAVTTEHIVDQPQHKDMVKSSGAYAES